MIRNFIFSVIAASLFLGCAGTTHNFKIRFNDIEGLRKNDQVFFDKTPIGFVTDVEYTEKGNYLVNVALVNKYSSLPKESSTFYIDSNPSKLILRTNNDLVNRMIIDCIKGRST